VTVVSIKAGDEVLRMVLPEAAALSIRLGDMLPVALDPTRFHLFSAADGRAMA
jgi:multiple sugar transport system ATP-binding protein